MAILIYMYVTQYLIYLKHNKQWSKSGSKPDAIWLPVEEKVFQSVFLTSSLF